MVGYKKNSWIVGFIILFFTVNGALFAKDQAEHNKAWEELRKIEEEHQKRRSNYSAMSREEIQESIDKLALAIERIKEGVKWGHKELQNVNRHQRKELERYFKGDKYVVSLYFINDAEFPEKYFTERGGKGNYRENKSDLFARQTDGIILSHYLGEGYGSIDAHLKAVHDLIAVEVLIKDVNELSNFLESQNLNSLDHIGEPGFTQVER